MFVFFDASRKAQIPIFSENPIALSCCATLYAAVPDAISRTAMRLHNNISHLTTNTNTNIICNLCRRSQQHLHHQSSRSNASISRTSTQKFVTPRPVAESSRRFPNRAQIL
jgi:hypothetical protein